MPRYHVGDWVDFALLSNAWATGETGGEIIAVACRRGRVIYTVRTEGGRLVKVPQGNLKWRG